jgi:hypothetical protein
VVDIDQRPAGEIAIDHHLENVVVKIGAREVPVIVVSLVEEVEAVETLDPAHLDLDIEVPGIVIHAVPVLGVHELIHADRVAVGDNSPVVGVAIDAGDPVRRELKDLERHIRAFQTVLRRQPEHGQHGAKEPPSEHAQPPSDKYISRRRNLNRLAARIWQKCPAMRASVCGWNPFDVIDYKNFGLRFPGFEP